MRTDLNLSWTDFHFDLCFATFTLDIWGSWKVYTEVVGTSFDSAWETRGYEGQVHFLAIFKPDWMYIVGKRLPIKHLRMECAVCTLGCQFSFFIKTMCACIIVLNYSPKCIFHCRASIQCPVRNRERVRDKREAKPLQPISPGGRGLPEECWANFWSVISALYASLLPPYFPDLPLSFYGGHVPGSLQLA